MGLDNGTASAGASDEELRVVVEVVVGGLVGKDILTLFNSSHKAIKVTQ